MTKITLPWMDRIRARKLEYLKSLEKLPIEQRGMFSMLEIDDFLEPVIAYGEDEEKRINTIIKEEDQIDTSSDKTLNQWFD